MKTHALRKICAMQIQNEEEMPGHKEGNAPDHGCWPQFEWTAII